MDVVEDVVEDLDGPAPGAARAAAGVRAWPAARSRESSRRPSRCACALVSGAVAAALAGGGVHHAALARAQHRLDRAVASLAVGVPAGTTGPVGRPGADGWVPYRVGIPLFERGANPVSVTVLGLDTPHQRTGRVPPAVPVTAESPATPVLGLQARCRDVSLPPAPAGGGGALTAVRARVEVSGTSRVVRLRPAPALHAADPFVQQLWAVCAHAGRLRAGQLAAGSPAVG